MSFNSLTFMAFFLAVAGIHWSPAPRWLRKWSLVLSSYAFYASWTLPFLPLLLLTTCVDYVLVRRMAVEARPAYRKLMCILGVAFALSLLCAFKYRAFILGNAMAILGLGSGPQASAALPPLDALPLGISFYTFESISYLVDAYLGRCKPAVSLIDYALFISFFPHLLAGPIVRPNDLLPQLHALGRPSRHQLGLGMTLVTVGLFQKIVVADQMALIANPVFAYGGQCSGLDMWMATLAFCLQIYCDFSGYSLCAIGMALMLGLVLNQNFNSPYAAIGFSDFWRRWHVSLSTWLRDYLYIPLGGSRCGRMRTFASLMATMFLGGLWHGASWTFALWGIVHGFLLVCEHLIGGALPAGIRRVLGQAWAQGLMGLSTFAAITVTWVLFRTPKLRDAVAEYRTMFGRAAEQVQVVLHRSQVLEVLAVALITVSLHWCFRRRASWAWWTSLGWMPRSALLSTMIILMLLTPGENIEFIYFQF